MSFLGSINIIFEKIKNPLKSLRELAAHYRRSLYQIEEIDIQTRRVIIHCRGTRTVIKTTIEAVVSDYRLIAGLSPVQACLIGGYVGRAIQAKHHDGNAIKETRKMSFLLENHDGQYRIVFQDRSGQVGYVDKKSKQEFVELPLTIVKNEYAISRFDPSQACYIGILAGISLEKAILRNQKTGDDSIEQILHKPPRLRVVS